MKKIVLILISLVLTYCSFAQFPEGKFLKAQATPAIDGILDPVWNAAASYPIANLIDPLKGTVPDSTDFKAWFKGMWDDENLYLFIFIKDDSSKIYDKSKKDAPHHYDQGELYFDYNYTRPKTYFKETTTAFEFFRGALTLIDTHKHSTGNEDGEQDTTSGWTQEFRIPLANLKNAPGKPGLVFGFDIHINDGDSAGPRKYALAWSDPDNTSWKNPRVLGKIVLVE